MLNAFLFGLLSTSVLVLGGLLGIWFSFSKSILEESLLLKVTIGNRYHSHQGSETERVAVI